MVRLETNYEVSPVLTSSSRHQTTIREGLCIQRCPYLANREWLERHRNFIGPGTMGYPMPPERSVDIDTPLDWLWAETLIQNKESKL